MKTWKLAFVLAFAVSLLAGCHDDSTQAGSAGTSTVDSASSGTATLSWEAPTTDTNGQPLTNLAGYRVYYGLSAQDLSQTIQITTVGMQTYVLDNLTPGTWYFAIRAVTSTGVESALSDVVSLTIS